VKVHALCRQPLDECLCTLDEPDDSTSEVPGVRFLPPDLPEPTSTQLPPPFPE